MPHLFILALAGAGLVAGYRIYRRETKRVAAALREAEASLKGRERSEGPTLERDPETGVYRPAGGGRAR